MAAPAGPALPTYLQPIRKDFPTGRVLVSVLLLLTAFGVLRALVTNENIDFEVVREFFFSPRILEGLRNTLVLTAVSMACACVLGTLLAVMRLSSIAVARVVSWAFVWLVRSVPPLVQIIFWFNLGFLFENVQVRVPFGPILYSAPTNEVMSVYLAAALGLTLFVSGYMAEIIRGGIQSVSPGQTLAGMSLGLGSWQRLFRIVLPQAMSSILPNTGNQVINMLKSSSLVSVIGLPDLLYSAQQIYGSNFQTIPLLIVATLWYVLVSTVLAIGQYYVERHFSRSERDRAPSLLAQLVAGAHRLPQLLRGRAAGEGAPTEPAAPASHLADLAELAEPAVPPVLRVRGLSKSYAGVPALRDVSFDVLPGEVVAVLGPSGSGKSTLLRTTALLEPYDAGGVLLREELLGFRSTGRFRRPLPERELDRQRARLGVVFQSFNLFGHLTALENVAAGPVWSLGESRAEALERAARLLERVGLADAGHKYPRQLSGGQQQRVAIARCLAMRPEVLLFDEPTSALDPELVGEVLRTIRELAGEGMTMVIVTHEIAFARGVADRVIFMKDGRVRAIGTPDELLDNPTDPVLASFLSSVG